MYKGEIVWGRTSKQTQWGHLKSRKRPESEWIRTKVDGLQIVSDELWSDAHERLTAARAVYLRSTDGKLFGKPANGVESRYLLTGMARCSVCNAAMQTISRSHGRKRAFYYGCSRAKAGACQNELIATQELADAAALAIMAEDVLAPEVISSAVDKLLQKFNQPQADIERQRAQLTAALRKAEREKRNVQAAIAGGDPPHALVESLRECERKQQALVAEVKALGEAATLTADASKVRQEAMMLLKDWRRLLLSKQTAISRQMIRKLLGEGRYTFYVKGTGAKRYYEMGVTPDLGKFIAAIPSLRKSLASPTRRDGHGGANHDCRAWICGSRVSRVDVNDFRETVTII
jgi:hypothetical protein